MENHFYRIRRAPLSLTIFITHVRNRGYANDWYGVKRTLWSRGITSTKSWLFYRITQLMHSFEINIRICQPENSDVHRGEAGEKTTLEGWPILMLNENECTNCFVLWHWSLFQIWYQVFLYNFTHVRCSKYYFNNCFFRSLKLLRDVQMNCFFFKFLFS